MTPLLITHSSTLSPYSRMPGWFFMDLGTQVYEEIQSYGDAVPKSGRAYVNGKMTVGKSTWETVLIPTKNKTYCLAIRKDIRLKESLQEGDLVTVSCEIPLSL